MVATLQFLFDSGRAFWRLMQAVAHGCDRVPKKSPLGFRGADRGSGPYWT